MPQGIFGSVAARLNEFLGGGGGSPGVFAFTDVDTFTIPGTVHNVGQGALLFKLYDAQIPANEMAVGSYSVAIDQGTYDVEVAFTTRLSGYIALGATSPLYLRTFTGQTTVTILGSAHLLGTSDLTYEVYDAADPANAMQPGGLTVHPTTHDVVLSFLTPTSGFIILSAGGPTYAVNFTSTRFVNIPGSVHQLGTRALLFNVYDAATPRNAMGDPATTIHPNTFDVAMDFGIPLSGRIVLQPATTLSGRDFDIRDAGVINQTAVRMTSQNGALHFQAGANNHIYLFDRLGLSGLTLDLTNDVVTQVLTARQLQIRGTDFQLRDGGIPGTTACGVGTAGGALYLQSGTTNAIFFADRLAAARAMLNPATGALGLGTLAPVHQLELSTNDAAKPGSASWLVLSDDQVKEVLRPFVAGLAQVLQLEPVVYRYNGKGGVPASEAEEIGLSAQALQRIAPYMVRSTRGHLGPDEPETDLLTVDGHAFTYVLINAVKELYGLLTPMRAQISDLLEQLTQLQSLVATLGTAPPDTRASEGALP